MAPTINSFSGRYRFLSNFYPCAVKFEDEWYPTVEHAYQAAKFPPEQRGEFLNLATMRPGEAKRRGRGRGGSDWHNKSLSVMRNLLREKFKEPKLRQLLLDTGDAELVEGNNWHDCFYGVCSCPRCDGKGSNHLGKGLMQVRLEIRHANQESRKSNLIDTNSETANMYGCEPCPKCGSHFRWPKQDKTIQCDDCMYSEDGDFSLVE